VFGRNVVPADAALKIVGLSMALTKGGAAGPVPTRMTIEQVVRKVLLEDTRAGEIELQIPKIGQGSYFPSFLEPRRRSEQALLSVVQQADVCGILTRRVDQLVESLGLRISKSEVSRVCEALDEHVDAFRTRPLAGRAATRTCFSMPRSRRSATAAGSSTRRWSSPTVSMRPAGARSSRSTSARPRPMPSGPTSSAVSAPAAWSACSSRSQTPRRAEGGNRLQRRQPRPSARPAV
jgi:hypothetical protein